MGYIMRRGIAGLAKGQRRVKPQGGLAGILDLFTDTSQTPESSSSDEVSGMAFNTTKVPGVCKPANKETLVVVTNLQKQMNRVAQVKGFSKIGVDGDIGAGTLGLFRKVQAAFPDKISGDASSCSALTANSLFGGIDQIASQVQAVADGLGAPSQVSGGFSIKTPSFVTPSGREVAVPGAGGSLIDAFRGMGTPMMLTFGGIMAGIGYFVFFDKPKRKGR